jgi:prophage regulatory protein
MSQIAQIPPGALEPKDSATFCAISLSTLDRLEREGKFPKRRQLSDKRVGHLVSDLQAWLDARPVSDLPPPPNTAAKKPRRAGAAGPAVPA